MRQWANLEIKCKAWTSIANRILETGFLVGLAGQMQPNEEESGHPLLSINQIGRQYSLHTIFCEPRNVGIDKTHFGIEHDALIGDFITCYTIRESSKSFVLDIPISRFHKKLPNLFFKFARLLHKHFPSIGKSLDTFKKIPKEAIKHTFSDFFVAPDVFPLNLGNH